MQSILEVSHVCVVCWKNKSLYEYGVAANKLFDYLYSGKPIINAYSGGYDLITRYRAGLTVPAEDAESLGKAILQLADSDLCVLSEMGANGPIAVKKNHEYGRLALKLNMILNRW